MIGAMSSSLSLAQRTASKARATMDTMSRQIATGQRVSSVKDDGAAWTRANGLRSNASARDILVDQTAQVVAGVRWARETGEIRNAMIEEAQGLAAAAMVPGQSASTIAANQAAYLAARSSFNDNTYTQMGTDLMLNRADGTGAWVPFTTTSIPNSTLSWLSGIDGSSGTWSLTSLVTLGANGVPTASIATTTDAATARSTWELIARDHRAIAAELGGLERRIESGADRHRARADLERSQAESLTGADMGRVSAAHALAETRQQLAVQTMRTAISAYGNFASSLLGNVQRTQRGIIA